MTRLQLRHSMQESVIALLMKKMRAAAAGSGMPWEDFFEDFILSMSTIIMNMTPADREKMMAAVQKSPPAGFKSIISSLVLDTKESPLDHFIAVALANISYRSLLPEEIPYLASRLVMKAMTDHYGLKYARDYAQACFLNPEKAYEGKAEDEIPDTNIKSEYDNPNISSVFTT